MIRIAPLLVVLARAAAAQDGTPILEFHLSGANPCTGLAHVEFLDRLRIDDVTLVFSGSVVEASISGALRCRGGTGSVAAIHASTDFTATTRLSANTCASSGIEIVLTDTAAATVVAEPFQARIASVLTTVTTEWADAACRAVLGYPPVQ